MASGVSGASIGPVVVEKTTITKDQKNPVVLVSAYFNDQLSQLKGAPIHEVREIAEGNLPIHYVMGAVFQKAILQSHHRYGPDPEKVADRSHCPFQAGMLRERFNGVLPQPNPLTEFFPESVKLRATIKAFFRQNINVLQENFQIIAEKWVDEISSKPHVHVYNAVSELSARFILRGILGYELCTHEDVRTNVHFWHKLFTPNKTKLQTLAEYHKKSLGLSILLGDAADTLGKVFTFVFDGIENLARKVVNYGLSAEGRKNPNFCAYCYDNLQNYQATVGLVSTILVAGQESTSSLLTALLYEYARNQEMQEDHRNELIQTFDIVDFQRYDDMKWGCYRAYLEALRMYAPGGYQREAAHDMVVRYAEGAEVKEHYIRKGEIIGTLPIVEGRNSTLFPNPHVFNPDRENLEHVKTLIFPFGYKMHQCPGEKGVVQEVMITITSLLPHVKIGIVDPMPPFIEATVYRPVSDFRMSFSKL